MRELNIRASSTYSLKNKMKLRVHLQRALQIKDAIYVDESFTENLHDILYFNLFEFKNMFHSPIKCIIIQFIISNTLFFESFTLKL